MDLIKREDAIKALTEVLFDEPPYLNSIEKCETFARKTLEDIPSFEPTIEIDADQLAKLLREGWTIHSEPKWIPCSERLPSESDDERVLVTTDVDEMGVIIMPAFDVKSWYRKRYASAWMPLPEPWEGADDAV